MNFPQGLDPREYNYATVNIVLSGTDAVLLVAPGEWIVLRVSLFTAAAAGGLQCSPADTDPASQGEIPCAANGSLCLEPAGYHRGGIVARGDGALCIVEFLFQTGETGAAPVVKLIT